MNHKIYMLTLLSVLHTILGLLFILFIIFNSFNINIPIIDFLVALIPISFILFNKCIHLDFYDFIKNQETENCDGSNDFPEYTRDGYFFSKLQQMLFGEEIISKRIHSYKLYDAKDIEPLCNSDDPEIIKTIFNEKIHYIVSSCIITVILLTKYKLQKLIPIFIIWFYLTFPQ